MIKQKIPAWKAKPGMIFKNLPGRCVYALLLSKTKTQKHIFKFVYLCQNGKTLTEEIHDWFVVGDIV